jgi:hypothetical protein
MLIIIFFSQIAQATTLEKFNVTCFLRGWHNKNISVCSIFSNHNGWNETLLVFRVLFSRIFFQTATFEILRYLFSAYHFPVLVQIATFEILRYLCDVIKHFPVLFQKQIHFCHRIYFLQVLYFIYFYYKMYQYYSML